MTRSTAILKISQTAFIEIKEALQKAEYHHCFKGGYRIDMSGIEITAHDIPDGPKPGPNQSIEDFCDAYQAGNP